MIQAKSRSQLLSIWTPPHQLPSASDTKLFRIPCFRKKVFLINIKPHQSGTTSRSLHIYLLILVWNMSIQRVNGIHSLLFCERKTKKNPEQFVLSNCQDLCCLLLCKLYIIFDYINADWACNLTACCGYKLPQDVFNRLTALAGWGWL